MTIEQTFKVQCKGRNSEREEFLETPVEARVRVYQHEGSNLISSQVVASI